METPTHDRALTFRRAYHYPFWQIEQVPQRWRFQVALSPFRPETIDPNRPRLRRAPAPRLPGPQYMAWPDGAGALAGAISRQCRSFQTMTPVGCSTPSPPPAARPSPRFTRTRVYDHADLRALDDLAARYPNLTVGGDSGLLLRDCAFVATQNSGVAFDGYILASRGAVWSDRLSPYRAERRRPWRPAGAGHGPTHPRISSVTSTGSCNPARRSTPPPRGGRPHPAEMRKAAGRSDPPPPGCIFSRFSWAIRSNHVDPGLQRGFGAAPICSRRPCHPEQEQRRDAAHARAAGLRVLVHVHLHDLDLAGIFRRPAPQAAGPIWRQGHHSPQKSTDRGRVADFLVEGGIGYGLAMGISCDMPVMPGRNVLKQPGTDRVRSRPASTSPIKASGSGIRLRVAVHRTATRPGDRARSGQRGAIGRHLPQDAQARPRGGRAHRGSIYSPPPAAGPVITSRSSLSDGADAGSGAAKVQFAKTSAPSGRAKTSARSGRSARPAPRPEARQRGGFRADRPRHQPARRGRWRASRRGRGPQMFQQQMQPRAKQHRCRRIAVATRDHLLAPLKPGRGDGRRFSGIGGNGAQAGFVDRSPRPAGIRRGFSQPPKLSRWISPPHGAGWAGQGCCGRNRRRPGVPAGSSGFAGCGDDQPAGAVRPT